MIARTSSIIPAKNEFRLQSNVIIIGNKKYLITYKNYKVRKEQNPG